MLKSSVQTLKSAPNIKWICVNFSLIHQKARTEFLTSLTFALWASATLLHVIENYGKENETLIEIVQILAASIFAAGFGWHAKKLVILHRMEKRGELHPSRQELGEIKL